MNIHSINYTKKCSANDNDGINHRQYSVKLNFELKPNKKGTLTTDIQVN